MRGIKGGPSIPPVHGGIKGGPSIPPVHGGIKGGPSIPPVHGGIKGGPSIPPVHGGIKGGPSIPPVHGGIKGGPSIPPACGGIKGGPLSEKLKQTTSDKETKDGHRYGTLYDFIFDAVYQRKGRQLRICEIGVSFFGEGSLKAFQELPIISEVVGIDILDYEGHLAPHTTFHKVDDAYTHKTRHMLKQHHAPFDIIIDDGSHHPPHQEFFLKFYGDLLSEGGYLICEDVYDTEFFKRMCTELACYGFDGSVNRSDASHEKHPDNERILIREKQQHVETSTIPPACGGTKGGLTIPPRLRGDKGGSHNSPRLRGDKGGSV